MVRRARGNRREIIDSIQSEIEGRLREAGIDAQVSGREKNLFSIYNKMEKKELQFHEVMDIYAFRVRVKDIDTCYRVLGQMHSLYKPRPGRFKDYIAIPKTNGYQSLHTSLVGPTGTGGGADPHRVHGPDGRQGRRRPLGLQAGWGQLGHHGPDPRPALDAEPAGAATERRQLLRVHRGGQDRPLPDEIYVFTPEGRIMELPAGATPVDFAYTVHTDIGHACVGSGSTATPIR
jgi:guanosine-3',5'-bis(diphosphate) 3'-pyrophosphohydrolase